MEGHALVVGESCGNRDAGKVAAKDERHLLYAEDTVGNGNVGQVRAVGERFIADADVRPCQRRGRGRH